MQLDEKFCDTGEGITLCYEEFGSREDPTALLVMGLGTQMIGWHEDFCAELVDRGFHVVRFDNRDNGLSTHLDFKPPSLVQLGTRRFGPEQYGVEDMSDDAARLVERLELGPVHVIGASMGGMIAQSLTARRPDLISSLTSIMSNSGHFWKGMPALSAYRLFLKAAPSEREAFADQIVSLYELVGSQGPLQDLDGVRLRAQRGFDRNHDPRGVGRQLGAILKSGNRSQQLRSISRPTTVIHGTVDKLVLPSGGTETARLIPGSELIRIENMGHDLPRGAWDRICDAIATNARRGAESLGEGPSPAPPASTAEPATGLA
ncbi:alpha/beta hydrolase [Thermoleophilia bacterium SCSIO 60948]|nr:alpha/beta hydrolase [Thermoleophilia bacterium SCSIO 60948]